MKGQETIPALMLFIFVISAVTAISGVVTKTTVKITQNNTGDFNTIAEAQLRASNYPFLIRSEFNYSFNNLAVQKIYWRGNPPGVSAAKDSFYRKLAGQVEKQVDRVGNCRFPRISSVNSAGSTVRHSVALESSEVICETSTTRTSIETSLGDSFTVRHPQNRYISALNYTADYSNNLKERLDGSDLSATGTGYSTCRESRQNAFDEAERDARNSAVPGIKNMVQEEKNDGDEYSVGWIDLDTSTDVNGNFNTLEVDSSDCSYRVCLGTGKDRFCRQINETEYSVKTEFVPSSIQVDMSITETRRTVMTDQGLIYSTFRWRYTYLN